MPHSHPTTEAVLAIAPILYTAWADGVLDADELAALSASAAALPEASRSDALRWLDPQRPPSASSLARLRTLIRARARELELASPVSLAQLGAALAGWGPEQAAGLARLEADLGFEPADAVRELLAPAAEDEAPEAVWNPSGIDIPAITRWLDGRYRPAITRARQWLSAQGQPPIGLTVDEHRALVSERVVQLATDGFAKLAYPGVVSDVDDLSDFLATFETLAAGDVSLLVKFGVQYGLFGGSIFFLGSDEQRQRYLPKVATGALLGCFAMTETGHGSNVMRLGTVARYLPETDQIEVTTEGQAAGKDYIGNAARDARLATVFAQLDVDGQRHGVHAVLVPIRDADGCPLPGVRIGDNGPKLGLPGVDNGRLWFDRVRVPRANLLSRFAQIDADGQYQSDIASPTRRFFTMLSTLVGGRVSVAAAALSAAKIGLTIAIHYGDRRKQFGAGDHEQAILDYTSHLRRLMPRLAKTYACHTAVRMLQERYLAGNEDDARAVETMAAGIKAYATWHNTDTLQACRECCGGAGYLAENRIGPLMNDTDVFTTFEGDNTVLMLLVAKSLLGEFKAQFHDSRAFALIKLIAKRAATELREKNPISTRRTSTEHIDDRDFQLSALSYREDTLVRTVAMRMKRRLDDGIAAFDAQNQVQPHLLAAARAHVERVVLECFYAAVEAAEVNEATRIPLVAMVDLYALSVIESDAAWFMEQGYIEGSKFRAIRARVTELCRALRPYAGCLVDGFGLPPECVAAPIATTAISGASVA